MHYRIKRAKLTKDIALAILKKKRPSFIDASFTIYVPSLSCPIGSYMYMNHEMDKVICNRCGIQLNGEELVEFENDLNHLMSIRCKLNKKTRKGPTRPNSSF